jgi:hypothetical protein
VRGVVVRTVCADRPECVKHRSPAQGPQARSAQGEGDVVLVSCAWYTGSLTKLKLSNIRRILYQAGYS